MATGTYGGLFDSTYLPFVRYIIVVLLVVLETDSLDPSMEIPRNERGVGGTRDQPQVSRLSGAGEVCLFILPQVRDVSY